MAADASIFAQYLRPPKSMSEFGQEMDAAEQNKLTLAANRMAALKAEQGMADEQSMRSAYAASGGDKATYRNALQKLGRYKEVQAMDAADIDVQSKRSVIDKNKADSEKDRLGMAKQRLEVAGQAFGYVKDNPSAEAAIGVVQHLKDNGIWDDAQAQKAIAEINANPTPEGVRMLATRAFQGVLAAKDQLPNYVQQQRGGTAATMRINPVTGKVDDAQTAQVTQSEAQRLALEQQAREAAAGRAVTMRGQNMTDGRAREANENGKALINQERQLKIDALQEKADATSKGKEAGAFSVANQIAVIDKAMAHPGRETGTGLSGAVDPRNYIPGTNATDFKTVVDQISGAAFLQAFESLRGGGAITEVEGKKATDAIARLNRAQSDKEFKTSLDDLRTVMTTGYKRMSGKEYQATNSRVSSGAVKNAVPSAEDTQAREWATKNPSDPRAKQIMQRLGGG